VQAWKDAPAAEPVRGLVRRPATAPVFDTQRFPAGEALASSVEYLWTVDWDLGDGPPVDSAVISFPALHLTAEWGRPGEVRHGAALPATLVHGAVSRVFRVRLVGAGSVVGARFRPGGALAWTGVDAVLLTDRAVSAAELPGPAPAELHERLAGLPPAERAAGFREALTTHQPPSASVDEELSALVARMAADPALVRVDQVVALSGWSLRTLQRRFRCHLGVSPKWVLARFRLQEAALAIERDPAVDLAELAVHFGWYDQAHLTNDFRRMLGETPGQYAARAVRS
jgi:AraC-like DNA-binding protein